jgi:hypothetical protein
MFKKAVCLLYCDMEYTKKNNHESTIIDKLEDIKLLKYIETTNNFEEKISNLPPGTIFCKDINTSKVYVSLPFFSSHLKIPVKVGEFVWIYEDKNEYNSVNSICNSYWISRIHGLFSSEDVNYTYNIRDKVLDIEKIVNNNENLKDFFVRLPTNKFHILKDEYKLSDALSIGSNDYIDNVPRYFSCEKDFTIQGTNNTLITLTNQNEKKDEYEKSGSKKGKILITTGRGKYFKEQSESSIEFVKTKSLKTIVRGLQRYETFEAFLPRTLNSSISPSIKNNLSVYENFKLPELLSNSEFKSLNMKRNLKEGVHNVKNDASSILMLEDAPHDYFSESESFLMNNIEKVDFNLEKKDSVQNINIKKPLSKKKTKETIISDYRNLANDKKSPLIGIYSSDIKIISRDDSVLNIDKKDGSIFLIKDSQSIEEYGEISIRENGNIILNGNNILIGDYKRENNAESGMGSSVIIGNGGELNSLVLGEKLTSLLSELIEINIFSLKLISSSLKQTKENFDKCDKNFKSINTWANTHIHNATGPTTPTTTAATSASSPKPILSRSIDEVSKKIVKESNPKLEEKLEDLIDKMDNILSRFSKTS